MAITDLLLDSRDRGNGRRRADVYEIDPTRTLSGVADFGSFQRIRNIVLSSPETVLNYCI